jgi:hypothetical protein
MVKAAFRTLVVFIVQTSGPVCAAALLTIRYRPSAIAFASSAYMRQL